MNLTSITVCQGRPSSARCNRMLSYLLSRLVIIRNSSLLRPDQAYLHRRDGAVSSSSTLAGLEPSKQKDLSIMLNQRAFWRWAKVIPPSSTLPIPPLPSFSCPSISSSGSPLSKLQVGRADRWAARETNFIPPDRCTAESLSYLYKNQG